MESDSEISNLKKDVQRLETVIKTQSDVILQLIERIGETFTKQAFTIDELMVRWDCGETLARKIIRTHKLKLLRGADGKWYHDFKEKYPPEEMTESTVDALLLDLSAVVRIYQELAAIKKSRFHD